MAFSGEDENMPEHLPRLLPRGESKSTPLDDNNSPDGILGDPAPFWLLNDFPLFDIESARVYECERHLPKSTLEGAEQPNSPQDPKPSPCWKLASTPFQ